MGIIRSNAAFYLEARARGVDFSRTLTLGRQRLYLTPADLTALSARYRPDLRGRLDDLRYGEPADDFLKRFLDVRELQALDHSAYEGAAITHDLNAPLPAHLREQFDAVIDSGTLEHVFNLPTAIATCMQLVKRGGTLFLSSPANNMCGHGFYQLSPELFFRLFKDANGFSLARLVLVTHPFPGAELSARQTWYDVVDPAEIGAPDECGASLRVAGSTAHQLESQQVVRGIAGIDLPQGRETPNHQAGTDQQHKCERNFRDHHAVAQPWAASDPCRAATRAPKSESPRGAPHEKPG